MSNYGFNTTSYDNQDRLTSWNRTDGALDQSWNLSKEGDWTSFTENTVTETRTHTGVHELTSIDSTPLTYDSKGNLTTNQNGQTYTWDFDNRMATATVPVGASEGIEGTHSYTYDALGRRVSKSVDDSGTVETTVFVCTMRPLKYSRNAVQVLAEYTSGDLASLPQRHFAYGTYIDEPVSLVDSPGATEQLYYYHANWLRSIAAITDNSGAVVERFAYTAYGVVARLDAGGSLLAAGTSSTSNPYTYNGRRLDDETTFRYHGDRYDDGRLGRLTARDSIGMRGYASSSDLAPVAEAVPDWRSNLKCAAAAARLIRIQAGHWAHGTPCGASGYPISTNMPHAHCLWNCRMTYHIGEKWAKRCSLLKEAYDLELCAEASRLSDECFASLPIIVQKKVAGTCCSAFQASDFKDNATGRSCGYKVGWKPSCVLPYYYSCADCCTDKGAGPDVPEGPGTPRPYGKHCKQRYEDIMIFR